MYGKKQRGMTLMELLVVLLIFILLGTGVLILLDPKKQIAKATNVRKKTDLAAFKKALEEFYNDTGCYPTLSQVCYLGGENPSDFTNETGCYLCGNNSSSPHLSPYMDTIICDSGHPIKRYWYSVTNEGDLPNPSCPSLYKAYAILDGSDDASLIHFACKNKECTSFESKYNYGVSSPNTAP